MLGQVTHFEIYGEKPEVLAEFYSSLFRWQLERAPGIDYWRIQTVPGKGKGLNGGLTYRPSFEPLCWVHYVVVDSVDESLAEAQRMGASVLRPKTAVPKAGWCTMLADPLRPLASGLNGISFTRAGLIGDQNSTHGQGPINDAKGVNHVLY